MSAALAPPIDYGQLLPAPMVAALSAPLPPEAIKPHPTKDYLSSIKAIYVIERLNEVFGIGRWTYRTRVVESDPKSAMVVMWVRLVVPEYGISLEQYGGSDNKDRGDAYKGAVTDALSKIGSYLGIGIDVYKGYGPTTRNPRATTHEPAPKVSKHAPTPTQQAVADAKLATMQQRKPPQPAAAIVEQIPEEWRDDREYEPDDGGAGADEPAAGEPSQLEQDLRQSIAEVQRHLRQSIAEVQRLRPAPKRAPDKFAMLQAFGGLKSRYKSIGKLETYYSILGLWGVRHSNEFASDDEGRATARACYKQLTLDVADREARGRR
jgi:hypothetical protein